MSFYLDSSAIVKLVQREGESSALRRFLTRRPDTPRVVSSLARVEVVRAVSSGGSRAVARARLVLDRLHELPIDRSLLDRAGLLDVSRALRSLDAIHLASALALGGTLQAVVTYDAGMAAAAEALGLEVTAPG
jgi:hypothetical protein